MEADKRGPKLSVVIPVYNKRGTIELQEDRFGFEPELMAKVAKGDWRVYEVPISYWGRTYAEGKKITWKDGRTGVWRILRYNLFG